jgi:hypothetical protein
MRIAEGVKKQGMEQLFVVDGDLLDSLHVFLTAVFVFVKEWQFLIGSLIILLAGTISVKALNRQIGRQHSELADRRRRLARVYRAHMLEDLQAICSYSRRSSDVARTAALIVEAKEGGTPASSTNEPRSRLSCPTLPTLVLANLKGLIETLDEDDAETIAELVRCYYAQHFRLANELENFNQSQLDKVRISKQVNFNQVFNSTMELYLRCTGLMKFVGRKTGEIQDTFSALEVKDAMKTLNIDHLMSPEAREYCLRLLSGKKL